MKINKEKFKTPLAKILLTILALLVVARMLLPSIIHTYLNDYLEDKVEGYTGYIEDFDLSLYRGAYQIQGFNFKKKVPNQAPQPFIKVKEFDLSLSWRALFRGFLLIDLTVEEPIIIFTDSADKSKQALAVDTEAKDWQDVYRTLVPFNLENLEINKGEVFFVNNDFKSPIEVYLKEIELDAKNIQNSTKENKKLFSDFKLSAKAQDHAPLKAFGSLNLVNKPLSFDINGEIKDFQLTKINNFFKAYGPLDITSGTFEFYTELASKDNKIVGYIKPMFDKVDVLDGLEPFNSFREFGFEIGGAILNLFFRNGKTLSVASKIPVEGKIDSPKFGLWEGFKLALDNAWGKPEVKPKIDNEINLKDVNKKE